MEFRLAVPTSVMDLCTQEWAQPVSTIAEVLELRAQYLRQQSLTPEERVAPVSITPQDADSIRAIRLALYRLQALGIPVSAEPIRPASFEDISEATAYYAEELTR